MKLQSYTVQYETAQKQPGLENGYLTIITLQAYNELDLQQEMRKQLGYAPPIYYIVDPTRKSLDDISDDDINELWNLLGYSETHSLEKRRWYLNKYFKDEQFEDQDDQFTFNDAVRIINWLNERGFNVKAITSKSEVSENA